MSEIKVKTFLETATSVAVILVAIVVLTTFVRGYLLQPPPQLQTGLQRGQKLNKLSPIIEHDNTKQTILLVAMNTSCHFCEESIPFYNQLTEMFQKRNASPDFLAVFPNSQDQVKAFVGSHNLKTNTLAAIDLNSLKVNGTPTMIWLDRKGQILDFWVGKLSKDDEQKILQTLGFASGEG